MSKRFDPEHAKAHGYTKKDWDAVDSPELSDDELSKARPFADVHPDIAAKMEKTRRGRPKSDNPKVPVSIRLDADVVEKFKATGPGWQSRINEILKAAKVG